MEERLKKFAILIDQGSYTAAARFLHTSQPALSTSIKKLERELKTGLLVTGKRPLQPTTSGRIAYEQGKTLRRLEGQFKNDILAAGMQKNIFRLGMIDSVAERATREHLFDILDNDCELSLSVQSSSELLKELKRGNLDMAYVTTQIGSPLPTLSSHPVGREQFSLYCSELLFADASELLSRGMIPNFLAYNNDSTTHKLIESQLLAMGIQISPIFYSTNPSVLFQFTQQGKGVSALPITSDESVIALELPHQLHRPIIAAYVPQQQLPKSAMKLLGALQQQFTV